MNTMHENDDLLLRKALQEIGLEEPSVDFTDRVTQRILEARQQPAYEYRPVISTAGWIFIATFIAVLVVLAIMPSGVDPASEIDHLNIFAPNPGIVKWLSGVYQGITFFKFTPVMKMSMVAFTLFGLVHIVYIGFSSQSHLRFGNDGLRLK